MTSKIVAFFAAFFAVFAFFAVSARAQRDDKAALMQRIDARRDHYATVAKEIWGFAEVGYQEPKEQRGASAGVEGGGGIRVRPAAGAAGPRSGRGRTLSVTALRVAAAFALFAFLDCEGSGAVWPAR